MGGGQYSRTQDSWATPFDPTDPNAIAAGLSSLTVQEAIIEAVNDVVGKARFCLVFSNNGTVGNNNWLGFSELLTSDTTPMIIPVSCFLKEMAFSFKGINVSGVLKIFKNGTANPANLIYSNTFTNVTGYKLMSGINIMLMAGDRIAAQWQDTGTNPSDAALQFFFQTN